jgi:hypothetical protein
MSKQYTSPDAVLVDLVFNWGAFLPPMKKIVIGSIITQAHDYLMGQFIALKFQVLADV